MREINDKNKFRQAFSPSAPALVARAQGELRRGSPVLMEDGACFLLVFAAERITNDLLVAIRGLSSDDPRLILTRERAETLRIPAYSGEAVHISLDPGIERTDIMAAIDPADDLGTPLKGPYPVLREVGGSASVAEGALLLAKGARLLPAVVCLTLAEADDPILADVVRLSLSTLHEADQESPARLEKIVQAHLPLEHAENTTMIAFRPLDGGPEHYALTIGDFVRAEPVLTRIHSECFTGDLLGSLKCDCGTQLKEAIARIAEEGGGVLLYLAQEGRGIGLLNKLRAYHLQDQGFDTVEANERLGFKPDERQFAVAAAMLKSLNVSKVRLLTNNPDKLSGLSANGIEVVERVAHHFTPNPHNQAYLETKKSKSGHLL